MNNNVVITVFEVESEAYQAFNQLKREYAGKDYTVAEAALIKNKANTVDLIDGFGITPDDTGTTSGVVIGSLVGILGGPIGVILGATVGAWAGSISDSNRALDNASLVAVVASKIYEGEIAIAALVSEEEPAFDAVFADYKTIIARYDAADIANDVDRLYELGAEINNQVIQEVKADHKAERAERHAERKEKISNQLEEYAEATNRTMGEVTPR